MSTSPRLDKLRTRLGQAMTLLLFLGLISSGCDVIKLLNVTDGERVCTHTAIGHSEHWSGLIYHVSVRLFFWACKTESERVQAHTALSKLGEVSISVTFWCESYSGLA